MSIDFVSIMENVSRSLGSVEQLISGLGFLLGLIFIITGIMKLRKIGAAGASSQESMSVPIAYFFGGGALIFLPSMIDVLSNTAFGSGNILQYMPYNSYDIYSAMGVVIQTAGLIWFVRGSALLVHASEPGVKEGPKGLVFVVAGVLAMNFEETVAVLNYMISQLMKLTGVSH